MTPPIAACSDITALPGWTVYVDDPYGGNVQRSRSTWNHRARLACRPPCPRTVISLQAFLGVATNSCVGPAAWKSSSSSPENSLFMYGLSSIGRIANRLGGGRSVRRQLTGLDQQTSESRGLLFGACLSLVRIVNSLIRSWLEPSLQLERKPFLEFRRTCGLRY